LNCRSCNASNVDGAGFCSKCGASLAPAPQFCNRCASPVKAGDVFCSKCGNNLAQPILQPAVVRPAYPPPPMAMVHLPRCPRCGSPAHSSYRALYIVLAVLLFPIGLVFLAMPKANTCTNLQCRFSW
jgi:double zinc ribbon protein